MKRFLRIVMKLYYSPSASRMDGMFIKPYKQGDVIWEIGYAADKRELHDVFFTIGNDMRKAINSYNNK